MDLIIVIICLIGKLGLREVKGLDQGHTHLISDRDEIRLKLSDSQSCVLMMAFTVSVENTVVAENTSFR